MQKLTSKIFAIICLAAMILAIIPIVAAVTQTNLLINTSTPPSIIGQTFAAGATIPLNFNNVTIPGAQFNLYISTNGLATIGGSDFVFGPLFDAANLTQVSLSTYTGGFRVGNNWINGSVPTTLAGGRYYAKLWDGNPADTVVTDTYFTILGGLTVTPVSGPAGASLLVKGTGFLANDYVNVTYSDILVPLGTVQNLTLADANGQFNITIAAPDTLTNLVPGEQAATTSFQTITFTAQQNSTRALTTATYTEYARGLLQVATALPAAGNVFGNNTVLGTINLPVNQAFYLSGNRFYPGNLTISWDGVTQIATATANATGFFNVSIAVPVTTVGAHSIIIKDLNAAFNVTVNVIPTLILTPKLGPVGTSVAVTAFGLPANSAIYIYWNEYALADGNYYWTNNATTAANGQFNVTVVFTVPHSYGGAHTVAATTTYLGTTTTPATLGVPTASAQFTVTPQIVILPSANLNNSGNLVSANGTGLTPTTRYALNLDNLQVNIDYANLGYETDIAANATGDLNYTFIDAGFTSGLHVVSIYAAATTFPAAYTTFMVGTANDPIVQAINSLNTTVTSSSNATQIISMLQGINNTITGDHAIILAINGTVATIQTSTGTINTSLTAINAQITGITGSIATLSTSMGTVTTSVNSLSASISSISNGVATIQTTLGTVTTALNQINPVVGQVAQDTATIKTSLGDITTSLASIGTTVTRIDGNVATIQTDVGTLQGTVTSISGNVATIQTTLGTMQANIGTLQTDVTATKDNTSSLSPLIIVAIVLALVAAIAAIASIVLMRRKIAG